MRGEETGRARPLPGEPLDGQVCVRRAYDAPADADGTRVLVDRIWPRGLRKAEAHLDEWCKEVAPSTTLRTWYGHDPAKFVDFSRRYRAELTEPVRAKAVQHLRQLADGKPLTLLTATRDPQISQAAVLVDLLSRGSVPSRTPSRGGAADAGPASAPDVDGSDKPVAGRWIVVGVDGSPGGRVAFEWAIEEARIRGCGVRAVMAWQYSPAYGDAWMWPVEGFDELTDCEQVLGRLIAEARSSEADRPACSRVRITPEVIKGHAGHALLAAAAGAELLAVGSRGHGGLVGALLGSVSQHVVAHARCPVVVVPDTRRPRADVPG